MPKALIVYSTRTGQTRYIADLIAEGLRFSAVDVTMKDVTEIRRETELAGYDIYVFGSSTYHGAMMDRMKTFLFLAERAELKGAKGGAFGSYGWSGKMVEVITGMLGNLKVEVIPPVIVKGHPREEDLKMLEKLADEILEKHRGINIIS